MTTVSRESAFAVWITGLPASGKSTVGRALAARLESLGVRAAVLESDALREVVGPGLGYDEAGRNAFYRTLVWFGEVLVEHGVPVIFDATANRRRHREEARTRISRFVEVYVDTPLAVCIARDPKGIYKQGVEGRSNAVPGLGADYEPPSAPEIRVPGETEAPDRAAARIVRLLIERSYIGPEADRNPT